MIMEELDPRKTYSDTELERLLSKWQSESETFTVPHKKFCLEMASKVPCRSLEELIGNGEKIMGYLKERVGG